ncbi:MAG TPA: hypothetical protein VK558_11030, partial [Patescibacteria group bacterium]|nr:hypothetical protein [Patescibacteria group bacterium]
MMDLDVLIAEVAKRHRFVLSPDDPVLATVTLTELAWQEASRDLEARLAAAVDLTGHACAAELRASSANIEGLSQRIEDILTA